MSGVRRKCSLDSAGPTKGDCNLSKYNHINEEAHGVLNGLLQWMFSHIL
jgi:hypothetical protein